MSKKELLDEIINLKERRKVLELECGVGNHNLNQLSRQEIRQMKEDINYMNACIALEMINSIIEKDEMEFRKH